LIFIQTKLSDNYKSINIKGGQIFIIKLVPWQPNLFYKKVHARELVIELPSGFFKIPRFPIIP